MLRTCLLLGCLATVVMGQGSGVVDTLSQGVRQTRYYCQPINGEDEDPDDGFGTRYFPEVGEGVSETTNPDVWTLWLQFPIISFLDPIRKEALFAVIADLIDTGATIRGRNNDFLETGPITRDRFCIGTYDQDDIADYSEGVILHIYFSQRFDNGDTARDVHQAFIAGFYRAEDTDGDSRVISFRGRDSIFLLGTLLEGGTTPVLQMNTPASNSAFDDDHTDDPTFNAVLIYSGPGNLTEGDIGGSRMSFASNPDPINYGLEAGDIVFAVFGSIFLAILSAAIVLGYCIHPFFLA